MSGNSQRIIIARGNCFNRSSSIVNAFAIPRGFTPLSLTLILVERIPPWIHCARGEVARCLAQRYRDPRPERIDFNENSRRIWPGIDKRGV